MYAKVRTDSVKKEQLPELDRIFQEFAEDHIQDKAQEKEWYCMLVFIADTFSECFLDLMEKIYFIKWISISLWKRRQKIFWD